jgi:hypothetical protein
MSLRASLAEAERRFAYERFSQSYYDVEPDDSFTFIQDTESSGGCETCWFDWDVVKITNDRTNQTYSWDGTFSEMLEALLEAGDEE